MKKEGFGPRATLMKTKSSRAGAVLFLGLLHSQPANTVVLHEGSTWSYKMLTLETLVE